eukprot:SAG22_NODE_398_length_11106_cov_67.829836_13_plen_233_part_01
MAESGYREKSKERLSQLLQGRQTSAAVVAWLLATEDPSQPTGERYSFIVSLLKYVRDQTRGINGSPSKGGGGGGASALERTASCSGGGLLSPVSSFSEPLSLGSPASAIGSGMPVRNLFDSSGGSKDWPDLGGAMARGSPAASSKAKKPARRPPARRVAPTALVANPAAVAAGNIAWGKPPKSSNETTPPSEPGDMVARLERRLLSSPSAAAAVQAAGGEAAADSGNAAAAAA